MGTHETHSSAEAGLKPREAKWEVWHEAYQQASTIDDRISLIHTCPTGREGLLFLLKEAEGFSTRVDFFLEKDGGRNSYFEYTLFGTFKNVGEARREIARTAFSRLVKLFFKDTCKDHGHTPSWMRPILEEGVLDAVIHFFRLDENHCFVNWPGELFCNPQEEHQARVLREFLFTLAKGGWEGYKLEVPGAEEDLATRRKELICILCGLDKLDYLLLLKNVGEEELEAVTELALARLVRLPHADQSWNMDRTLPQNIEEAAYAGSQAGKVAILLREKLKLDKHYAAIQLAYRKQREAEQELRRLSETQQE